MRFNKFYIILEIDFIMQHKIWNKIILIITSIVLIGLEIYSLSTDSHYKWDFIFLMLLLVGVYVLGERIKLHPFHYLLWGMFLISHNLGTFGTYSNTYFGIEYDFYTHMFFGIVCMLIMYRADKLVGSYRGGFKYLLMIAIILGFSGFHELFEYVGAILVGEGEGVLFIGAGDIDEWDTQKDMMYNLFGALFALGIYKIINWKRG